MKFLKILFVLVIFSLPVLSMAQENEFVNDPNVNEDANACYEGGSMEGKCNSDSDGDGIASEDEIEWAWRCGWYLIRLEYGLISPLQFPADCASLLGWQPDPLCIFGFIYYTGYPNVARNVYFPRDETGGCGDPQISFATVAIVQSDTIEGAMDLCTGIFGFPNSGFLIYQYPGPEENLWICYI